MKKNLLAFLVLVLLSGAGCPGNGQNPPPKQPPENGNTEEPSEPAPTPVTDVQIYLVALTDGSTVGPVGCGDSVVAVTRQVSPTTDPLKTALQELFSIKTPDYGQSGLSHTLYQSSLSVDSITRAGNTVTVALTGSLSLNGVCDNPRVEAQITETIKYYAPGEDVVVTLNGKLLADALSLK